MIGVVKSMLSASTKNDDLSEYSVEYSFASEYNGPPVSYDIPQVVPVDVHRIPTAAAVAKASVLNNLSVPVVQPIAKSGLSKNRTSNDSKLGSEVANLLASRRDLGESRGPDIVSSRELVDGVDDEGAFGLDSDDRAASRVSEGNRSSGTLGFSDSGECSNDMSGSSDVEDLNVLNPAGVALEKLSVASASGSSEISSSNGVEDYSDEAVNRGTVVTFRDPPSWDTTSEGSDHDEMEDIAERPVARCDLKQGSCHKCLKVNRLAEKEVCIVCGAKYCRNCVIRAMGSMPEGRKCITCIGFRIDESKRGRLGKCSRPLRRLLPDLEIKRVMSAEVSCKVNQLPPHLFFVNGKPLSSHELVQLQSCENPPKKLKPGNYWYDKVSGFWGKEGEKPCQIITPQLAVGPQLSKSASNGNTGVVINGREITKTELLMLKLAGIRCEGNPSYWLSADGDYQLEGQRNVMGKLWQKTGIKLVCAALSLPVPPESKNPSSEVLDGDANKTKSNNLNQNLLYKLLLVGCDQSGTSTLFKQAKILNEVPFSEDERQSVKFTIQRNLYGYVAILLEGREKFEEDYLLEMRQRKSEEPGPSAGPSDQIDGENIYSMSEKLKSFSDWLLQVNMLGNLEAIFPAATREYSPLIEELWKDKGFQAAYSRRSELQSLPGVANYFLDRATEITKVDYEPSDMDILYGEGITSSNGVASMEFSFQESSEEEYLEPGDQDNSTRRYQLIRVNARSLGENCKWLEMFEDVNIILFCVSLTDYNEFYEDFNGVCTNKMLATRKFFESIITHPRFTQKHFLLILNKFDLLEERIENFPLTLCDWFEDFNPVISHHPNSRNANNNSSLAQRTFHHIAVKFKRLFESLTGRKLYVLPVTGLEPDSVDEALRYVREILKWEEERPTFTVTEWSSASIEASTS